jgi:hypothetical protein
MTIADWRFGLSIGDCIVDCGLSIGLSIGDWRLPIADWQSPMTNDNRQSSMTIANLQ